jgi:hypothetical protein
MLSDGEPSRDAEAEDQKIEAEDRPGGDGGETASSVLSFWNTVEIVHSCQFGSLLVG